MDTLARLVVFDVTVRLARGGLRAGGVGDEDGPSQRAAWVVSLVNPVVPAEIADGGSSLSICNYTGLTPTLLERCEAPEVACARPDGGYPQ